MELRNSNSGSCEMVVMSDEIIGMVKRMLRGVPVDRDSLAVEVTDRVGPGGHYLTDEHTLAHMRSEFWRPTVLNRDNLEIWHLAEEGRDAAPGPAQLKGPEDPGRARAGAPPRRGTKKDPKDY
jgi:trimethylamine:corrinoid methyltransferase-like protein